ncbi:MAG: 50S ribosomal protein L18 [Candidatus Vogelbacteria bacterium RIFOXYD1_FULL_46_19]|uniref:Large ribosomal subunit protein uL18 n=1 Tax=Candidatus Vogelbacteria bacterium RIFOXYD1_FULL_46_19 TaxID=1802439 RepID=A0A1G2QI56_9BACT|nr:MAG: 50S ribosomal protein L18 [Candidatus Vogelbacteria bacterium RIFOXYD1_FULL_46_19]
MIAHIQKKKAAALTRRHQRIRARLSGTALRPRLLVKKSNRYTRAALIDDLKGATLAAASTVTTKVAKGDFAKVESARALGLEIANLAKAKKISKVVFDRGGNRYTGRVKAVAEGAREGGLEF